MEDSFTEAEPPLLLDSRQEKAVELLFLGRQTLAEIAKECGVSDQTILNWRKKAEFQKALTNYARRQRERAYSLLEAKAETAAMVLVSMMGSENDTVRLKASLEILEMTKLKRTFELKMTESDGITSDSSEISKLISQINRVMADEKNGLFGLSSG